MTTKIKVITHQFVEAQHFNSEVNKALEDGYKFVSGNELTAFGFVSDLEEINIQISDGFLIAILAK